MPDEGTGNWKEEAHAKALHEIADYLKNCYVIDLYHEAPKYGEEFRSKYFCGHMNAMGYLLTAHYFMTYIDWIIRHNVHDFRFVQFIGSDKILVVCGFWGVRNGILKEKRWVENLFSILSYVTFMLCSVR